MSCLDEHRIPNTLPPIFEEETQMSVLTRVARHTRFVLLAVALLAVWAARSSTANAQQIHSPSSASPPIAGGDEDVRRFLSFTPPGFQREVTPYLPGGPGVPGVPGVPNYGAIPGVPTIPGLHPSFGLAPGAPFAVDRYGRLTRSNDLNGQINPPGVPGVPTQNIPNLSGADIARLNQLSNIPAIRPEILKTLNAPAQLRSLDEHSPAAMASPSMNVFKGTWTPEVILCWLAEHLLIILLLPIAVFGVSYCVARLLARSNHP